MITPRFDWLAPYYAAIEAGTYGRLLQACRTALLGELLDARHVLILGEGDGRFLAAFLRANKMAKVDVIDVSPAMMARARQRIAILPGALQRVKWHVSDARRSETPGGPHDLIVTNFFLDCFTARELEPLIERLARSIAEGGRWLVGDFALPAGRLSRVGAKLALAVMYGSFGMTTRIAASRLVDPKPLLLKQGLRLVREKHHLGGFLSASLWQRG